MKSKNELHAIERDLYQLFDMVWAKFYAQIKNKPLFDKTEVDLTEAESFVLDKGPKWLQNIGYYRDLVGNQQQDFCFEHNQDRPCKICAEKDQELPPREKFKRMKQELRDWIEKEPKTEHIQVDFIVNEKANDGRKGIQFIDADESDLFDITIWDWPRIGLVDGAVYTPEELLITGEAGEE